MAQLNDFSGGLVTRLHPGYIAPTEGVIFTNIDPSRNTIKSMFAHKQLETTSLKNIYVFKGEHILTNDTRDYVELNRKLYYTDGEGRPQKSEDGKTFYNLGITGPSEKPIISASIAGSLNGTVQYCYTYYNEKDGTESQSSPYSDELQISAKSVTVNYYNSTDPQVTHVRIYRMGDTLLDMFLVAEIENDESLVNVQYTDNTIDTQIIGYALTSQNNAPAFVGLQYLTEADATLFAAKENKLYYTDIGFPDYWNEFNFILIDDTITGISDSQLGLLVFTKYKTFLISYGGSVGIMKTLLSGSQGCVAHRSIQYVNNMVIWASTDGICATANGSIELVSQNQLCYLSIKDIKASCVHNEIYYLVYENETLALDTRYNKSIFRKVGISPSSLCVYEDEVYFIDKGFVQILEGNNTVYADMHYKSGLLSDGSLTTLKLYKNFYVSLIGTLTINLFIDDELLASISLESGVHDIKVPGQDRYGYTFSFEVKGKGELVELEYKTEARQNGR